MQKVITTVVKQLSNSTFKTFSAAIQHYNGDPLSPNLLMAQDGPVSVYYAPFEWVNPNAKVVLVGITPGKVQAANALAEAKRALADCFEQEVLRRAKATGAFSGAMRPNLVALLDAIRLHDWLGLNTCSELFGSAGESLQTTSVLQFPVFLDGENYNGTPDPINRLLKYSLRSRSAMEHIVDF